jgi:hypothetical protein
VAECPGMKKARARRPAPLDDEERAAVRSCQYAMLSNVMLSNVMLSNVMLSTACSVRHAQYGMFCDQYVSICVTSAAGSGT